MTGRFDGKVARTLGGEIAVHVEQLSAGEGLGHQGQPQQRQEREGGQ